MKKKYLPWEMVFKSFLPENVLMISSIKEENFNETSYEYDEEPWMGFGS